MKTCTKCGLARCRADFTPDKRRKDGLQSWCRPCNREGNRAHYCANLVQSRQYHREHYNQNQEQCREIARASYHRDIELSRLQARAHSAVQRALSRGEIAKPDHCEVCNRLEQEVAGGFEAHHYLGYAREHYLDIQWLCIPCHREAELLIREAA